MEMRLVEYFADEFNKQLGNGVDVRQFPKAMAKLKKQVKRTKEILSANNAAPISVESLHDDRDFRYIMLIVDENNYIVEVSVFYQLTETWFQKC